MIDETYAVFAAWDFGAFEAREPGSPARRELHRRQAARPGCATSPRCSTAASIRTAATGRSSSWPRRPCSLEEWKPLLLWHMTRDEFLAPRLPSELAVSAPTMPATFRVRPEDVADYLRGIGKRGGTTEHAWTETTTEARRSRPAEDRRRLRPPARRRSSKEFASYHLPERSFLYLLHAMRDERHQPEQGRSRRPTGACS